MSTCPKYLQAIFNGDEPTFANIPLCNVPSAGDESALIGVLARILVDLCTRSTPETITFPRPLKRLEAA